MALLDLSHLSVDFATDQGTVYAVRDISFSVEAGEIVGIVGESGSGKSVSMYALMGLLAENGKMHAESMTFDGQRVDPDAFTSPRAYEKAMEQIRGNTLSMIFQDPMTFLNPTMRIGRQLMEPILNHQKISRREARAQALEMMRLVGIPSPEERFRCYPHEFSGGMRQRIIIAMALCNHPRLMIADEPTTALDVTIQAQILELIRDLTRKNGSSTIIISHDLGVVASLCDRILIMYGGKIVETGTDLEIFKNPQHPYTQGLLGCVHHPSTGDQELHPIGGTPPDLLKPPVGCPFVDRCPHSMQICRVRMPEETAHTITHQSSCWLHEWTRRGGEGHA